MGVSVSGVVSPLKLKPVPEIDAAVTVTFSPPVFFKVTICEVASPKTTLPKLMLVGLAVKSPEVAAVPETGMFNVGFWAFDVTATLPLKVPAEGGVNVTLNETLCPAVSVTGSVIPETLKPVPVAATPVTCALVPPVFLIVSVCVEFAPTRMLVKVMLVGFAVNVAGVTPVPLSGMPTFADPLTVSDMVPLTAPAEAGVKITLNDEV